MTDSSFASFRVYENDDGSCDWRIEEQTTDDLPEGDVVVDLEYSSLNYKDALSAKIHHGITRHYPHTPGVDAAGIVRESLDNRFSPGEHVIVTGYDLGMNTAGGFGGRIRVPGNWVVPTPSGWTSREAMTFGTAGFTAAIARYRLERHGLEPEKGDVVVTGATGGVGTMSVAILARGGYSVTASTGKLDQRGYLEELGATAVIDRNEISENVGKPLAGRRWAGAVDTVGGNHLAALLSAIDYEGGVAACGNVAGNDLATTIYPFILRGVALIGINSATTPRELRLELWNRLASDWKPEGIDRTAREVRLDALGTEIDRILNGEQVGRVLVRHDA